MLKKAIKPVVPRCGICRRFYSFSDDDGSGLCPACRPRISYPLIIAKHRIKKGCREDQNRINKQFQF